MVSSNFNKKKGYSKVHYRSIFIKKDIDFYCKILLQICFMQVQCMNFFSFKNYGKLRSQFAL